MLFNSPEFLFIFLPATFFLYFFALRHKKVILSKIVLIVGSLFFYGYWNPIYLWLLTASILFNYFLGTKILELKSQKKSKILLIFGVFINLVVLGYFKYSNFFLENLNYFIDGKINATHIILPLGISFITFQKIAFLFDCHQKKLARPNFYDYSLFVSFFPQLIAGPIVHHSEIIPQFKTLKSKFINHRNISLGIFIFAVGLFKKVIIADSLASYNFSAFQDPELLFPAQAWLASFSYSLQIYFDFSGYSDMAIGAALLFNIKLPFNFNSPYKAGNIQDFWGRWHMTLSRFLKDYIYIPLGGSRLGEFRTYINLLIVFFISGLWHGASWAFVMWGMLHGAAICVHRLWVKFGFSMNKYLGIFTTFMFVNFAWIFFRMENFNKAILMIKKMLFVDFDTNSIFGSELLLTLKNAAKLNTYGFVALFSTTIICYYILPIIFRDANDNCKNFKPNAKYLIIFAILFSIAFYNLQKPSTFIYFNF